MTSVPGVIIPTLNDLLTRWPCVVFDLDGTLFDDSVYLRAADLAVARRLAEDGMADEKELASRLAAGRASGSSGLFDRTIKALGLPASSRLIMLEVLRTVDVPGGLPLNGWAKRCLEQLSNSGRRLFILTNGNPQQQRNKVKLLGLDQGSIRPEPVFANEYCPKPHPAGLLEIARRAACRPRQLILIGNDGTDQACAASAGAWFAHAASVAELFAVEQPPSK